MISLESLQHYNDGGPYMNPKDHPAEVRQRDGEYVSDEIYGEELNDGKGYLSFKEARASKDFFRGNRFKIDGTIYIVVMILGKLVFDYYAQTTPQNGITQGEGNESGITG